MIVIRSKGACIAFTVLTLSIVHYGCFEQNVLAPFICKWDFVQTNVVSLFDNNVFDAHK